MSVGGNLPVTGTTTASNSNPFYIAGRVATNGSALGSKGRINFSSTGTTVGVYIITPDTAFGNTNYIVSITCQVDGVSGFARLNANVLSTSSFTVVTYINSVLADAAFHFTVIN